MEYLVRGQAHADALGTWGGGVRTASGQVARRGWEGDGRIDLRSVTNCLRQLPYHVAWQRGFRQAATVLNPTIAIDIALETARDLDDGALPPSLLSIPCNLPVGLGVLHAACSLAHSVHLCFCIRT
jgi:hypothetical protein